MENKTAEEIIKEAYDKGKAEFPHLPFEPFNFNDRGNQIIFEAMESYASQQSKIAVEESREKVIQECIDCFHPVFQIPPHSDNLLQIMEAFQEAFAKLTKLKK